LSLPSRITYFNNREKRPNPACGLGITGIVLTIGLFSLAVHAQQAAPLTLSRTISLTGVQGKFDHLAIDIKGNRLFIAATGNHSVEVIDLKSNKVQQSIVGLGKPHGLA
jgi:DNA-binding beta-propeller fold protein YncE